MPPVLDPSDLDRSFFVTLLGRLEDPIFVKDEHHRWIFTNEAFEQLVGRSDLVGRTDQDVFPREQYEEFYEGDRYVLETQRSLTQEESIGPEVWGLVKKTPVTLSNGRRGILGIIIDITEYRSIKFEVEALRLARRQALHDPLTDLPNRRHLEEFFAEVCAGSSRQDAVILMHIDLDGFKPVNDEHGHAAGDAVLVEVARRIADSQGPDMFAARIGGDEFVVLSVAHRSLPQAQHWAETLLRALRQPIAFEDKNLIVGASAGVAAAADVSCELDALMHAADLALYQAKDAGRNRVATFDKALGEREQAARIDRAFLDAALTEGQLQPFYQPQFDLTTGAFIGAEALARWHHPERGLLTPPDFLPMVEADGRIDALDLQILDQVLADGRAMVASGLTPIRLAINMSPMLLFREDLLDLFRARAPFPCTLAIEFSETISFETLDDSVKWRIDGLKALGCEIEIDDFGSSQASIQGVINLRPDRLKLDQHLVMPLGAETCEVVVTSILQIAAALDIPVVAEGIETQEQLDVLRKMGCVYGQGFLFAPPIPADAFADLLARNPNDFAAALDRQAKTAS